MGTYTQYTTLNEITEYHDDRILNQLSFDTGDESEIDTDVIESIIKSMNNFIDGYVKYKYITPIANEQIPDYLKAIARFLVIYELHIRRHNYVTNEVMNVYNSYIKQLEKIKDGIVLLDLDLLNDYIGSKLYISTKPAVFTNEILNKY